MTEGLKTQKGPHKKVKASCPRQSQPELEGLKGPKMLAVQSRSLGLGESGL